MKVLSLLSIGLLGLRAVSASPVLPATSCAVEAAKVNDTSLAPLRQINTTAASPLRQGSLTPLTTTAFVGKQQSQLQDDILGMISQILSDVGRNIEKAVTCALCRTLVGALKVLAALGQDPFKDTFRAVCLASSLLTPAECNGFADNQAPPLWYMLTKIDPLGEETQQFCARALLSFGASISLCDPVPPKPYTVAFPKVKPAVVQKPAASGQLLNVVQFADLHIDYLYKPDTEAQCDTIAIPCCRGFNATKTTATRRASTWGDYHCDTAPKLAANLLESIVAVSGKPDFSISTADIDPHDVALDNKTTSFMDSNSTYGLLHSKLDAINVPLFSGIGNHEYGPVNQAEYNSQKDTPTSSQYLYELLANVWKGWLPDSALEQVRSNGHGSYAFNPAAYPKLRLISLQNILTYHANWYAYPRMLVESDPDGTLAWLVKELDAAETNGERAWIFSHIPPGNVDQMPNYSDYYRQVIERYNETIAAQFAGHTHRDEFAVQFEKAPSVGTDPALTPSTAIGVSYISPSMTTYTELNPGWRVYLIDSGSFEVMDSRTYIADMSKAAEWDAQGTTPTWFLEYSARDTYGPALNWPAAEPLTPAFWAATADRIGSDPAAFEQYFRFRGKSSGLDGTCSFGDACATDIATNLKVTESFNYVARRSVIDEQALRREGKNEKSGQHYSRNLCGVLSH